MKMFRFVKKVFFIGSLFLSNLVSTTSLSCISTNNQECKARPEIINVNSSNPIFYPFSVKASKCSGNFNNCVPDIIKNLNVEVFDLMSRTNETRHIKWHETSKCECKLGAIVFDNVGIKINVNANVKN